ncbi:MAG TPA: hypothetical protein VMU80_10745 [Bryobacteraceae bacterium]|nr:hypothetical protein [Bryobacteraceae bacterium]
MLSLVDLRCYRAVRSLAAPGHVLWNARPFALLAALLAVCGGGSAQVGLGLAPMREELTLDPGAVHSGVLTLSNTSSNKLRAVAAMLDFYLDDTATPQFGPDYKQEAEFSCRTWLSANPMEMELNGKAQLPVRYTLRVPPATTARSYHCAIGFTTLPTAEEVKAIGLRTAVQIVAAIYVVVGKPALEGTVKDLRLEYVAGAKTPTWRAVVTIRNAGLLYFRPVGELDVLNAEGAVVETCHFVPLPVLPKRDQNFLFPLKLAGGPGKYTLRARVDLGANEIQEATALVVAANPVP